MSISITSSRRPSLPATTMAEGRKTALVVLLGFALIGAVCVALSPFMTNEATGPAAARDCTGVCVEQIV